MLEKKGQRRVLWRDSWKTRRFELRCARLRYLDGRGRAKVEVVVVGADDVPDRPGKRQHRFDARCEGGRTLALAAPSAADKERWLGALAAEEVNVERMKNAEPPMSAKMKRCVRMLTLYLSVPSTSHPSSEQSNVHVA